MIDGLVTRLANRLPGLEVDRRRQHLADLIAEDKVEWGAGSYGTPLVLWDPHVDAKIRVGKYCSIADGVALLNGSNHDARWVSTYPFRILFEMDGRYEDGQPCTSGDLVVDNDVWIARGVTILSGSHVGSGAVIGAGAVVTGTLAPYGLYAGNPARLVRKRFPEHQIEALLQIRWWDWPRERIRAAIPLLSSPDVDAFLDQYGSLVSS